MPDFAARPTNVRLKDTANVVPLFRDGLISLVSGMGTTTDPRSYNRYFARRISDQEIDQAYRGSWVMRKAIDKPATEMVREWRDWQADQADIEKIEAEEKRLDLRNMVRRAEILRGLGGAGMVLYVGGNEALQAQPLDPAKISAGDLKRVHVWHRSRFTLGPMIDNWADDWFGHPSYYEVQMRSGAGTALRFHPSRVVAFKAEQVGDIIGGTWTDAFWGQSKVQTIMDAAQNVDTAENGFAALIKDARNRRIYIPKLLEMLATAAGETQLARRLQAFAIGESSNAVSWLDGGDGDGKGAEKIEDRQMVWNGMPDLMNAYRTAFAAAADMPDTVMWSTSPKGMNATGDSDLQLWHKMIKGKQDLDLRPCMTQIDAALIPSALGKVDDDIWYQWAPLATQSEKDEATTFFTFMQAIEKLQATASIPAEAFDRALQSEMEERGWLSGIGDALSKIPEDERFGISEPDPNEPDPSALTQLAQPEPQSHEGGDPAVAAPVRRRRAANDARKRKGGGRQAEPPFLDGYDPAQPRGKNGRWVSALAFVEAVLGDPGNKKGQHRLGAIPGHVHIRFGKLGITHRPLSVAIDHDSVRHAMKRHGSDSRGQKALQPHDLSLAHRVLVRGEINHGNPPLRDGLPLITAKAKLGADEYTAVFHVRKYRAVLVTMRKR